jgi:hypothetical protein
MDIARFRLSRSLFNTHRELPSWIEGFAGPTNIWEATIDLSRLSGRSAQRPLRLH